MYTGHFGLDDGPFHGKAEGTEVYVGPQQAVVVARLRKVLAMADTAVAVSGPVGVGKTTLVRRVLADLAGSKNIIPVDRMRLEPDEVLDLLLSRFDVSRQPKGTIQRVAAFRRLLHERLANDTRVFIVVEDAERVGVDALLEIEALTATDSGEPVGANIVLMGAGGLPDLLARPALARLRQRIRLRQAVAAFDEAEVEGYMRHCLESAGGVLEQIFEPGTPHIVYRYSAGIARVIDNLCESALVAAAEAGLATILPEFLQEVAESCGLEPQLQEADAQSDERVAVPAEVDDATEDSVAAEAEVEAGSFAPAVPLVTPPKLALVEPRPRTADEAITEVSEGLPGHTAAQPEADGGPELPRPVADEVPECAREAEPALHAGEWKSPDANVTASRIDEVLPELIERLQAHAYDRVPGTAGAAPRVDRSSDDSMEIPTLSSSMRVAILPVRSMEERPRTAEDVDEDEVSVDGPVSAPVPLIESEADKPDTWPDETTGIVPALSESAPEMEPEAESVIHAVAELVPVETAIEDVTEAEEPAGEIAEPKRLEDEPELVEASYEGPEDLHPPLAAEAAEVEPLAHATVNHEPAAEESADLESALLTDESMPPAAVGADGSDDESDDEATTEAVTLSMDEELALAPDAATDVFAADEMNAVDGGEPELDALQAAIQAANAWQASDTDADAHPAARAPLQSGAPDLPEITLDVELEKRKPVRNDLDRLADELSKAKGLEDISDILAETIFGNEEMETISAGIRARKAAERTAEPAAAPSTPASREPRPAAAKANTPRPSVPHRATAAATSRPEPKAPPRPAAGNAVNMTMSQRIEMVNSLKGRKPIRPIAGMRVAEIVLAEQPDEVPHSVVDGPQPIEAQIDTAITQSRRVLSEADLARLASPPDDDDDDKGRRGLFGFFRRSSKT